MFEPDADLLTKLCFETFDSLPTTRKPILGKEWTVLSCIVKYNHDKKETEVVAMGTGKRFNIIPLRKIKNFTAYNDLNSQTGTKCIGRSSMSAEGDILNDCHAEIMCRRGFLRYIYEEIVAESANSIFSFNDVQKKFKISKNISFHFVTTYGPCGDASIFKNEEITEKIEDNQSFQDRIPKPSTNCTGAKIITKTTEVQ